jgi:AcrR family transcriptional regulator
MVQQRADLPPGRSEVVRAVVDLALAGGYSSVTWEAVARRSGLGLREVQQHAGTLDDLLLLALESSLERWVNESPMWSRHDPVPGLTDAISRRLLTGVDAAAACPEFWALGILLALTAGHGARAARERYREVRANARAAMNEWWTRILPPEVVAADPRLPSRLTTLHLALVDGFFVAQQSGIEWNLPLLVRTVSSGLSSYVTGPEVAR